MGELAGALRASREEVAAQVAAATAKDRENSQLWEQARLPCCNRCNTGLCQVPDAVLTPLGAMPDFVLHIHTNLCLSRKVYFSSCLSLDETPMNAC